ncbi:MAG: DNA internalization-related competence protein ComEC/Rec2, partial [Pseudomonadales bacterium]|nr:DNA internalization-related competence protein ComEC/Rec2 [Pseudomonadales bacterium]
MRMELLAVVTGLVASMLLHTLVGWLPIFCLVIITFLYVFFPRLKLVALFSLGMLFGIHFSWHSYQEQLPDALQDKTIEVTGFVSGLPVKNDRATTFDFVVVDSGGLLKEKNVSLKKIRLSWYRHELPESGSFWRLSVRLKRPRGLVNPAGFDYQRWLLEQRIQATGYVKQGERITDNEPGMPFSVRVSKIRQKLQAIILNEFTTESGAAIARALIIGDKSGLSARQKKLFFDTGTGHLMVVSGLHIGLMVLFGYGSGSILSRVFFPALKCLPHATWALLAGFLFAFVYAFLAGFSLSTQRALVMCLCAMVAMLFCRVNNLITPLLVALLVVVLLSPLSVFSVSLWFSFTACFALLLVYSSRLKNSGFYWNWIRPQWSVFIAMTPLLLLVTGSLSIFSPLANFVAVPFVSFILLPLCLLTGLAGLSGFPVSILVAVIEPLIAVLDSFLGFCCFWEDRLQDLFNIPPAHAVNDAWWSVLMSVLGALCLLMPKGLPFRYLGILLFLPLCFPAATNLKLNEMKVLVFDVGQGLSVFVQTKNHQLLYDIGPRFTEDFDAGSAIVAPAILRQGIGSIDLLMISHADLDHAGGAEGVLSMLDVARLASGMPDDIHVDRPIEKCMAGHSWRWDGFYFEVISPMPDDEESSDNDLSCVLKISNDFHSLLLPGDIEKHQEYRLLETRRGSLAARVILAPHHGSKTSSSLPFVKAVNPEVVVYSSGYRNR